MEAQEHVVGVPEGFGAACSLDDLGKKQRCVWLGDTGRKQQWVFTAKLTINRKKRHFLLHVLLCSARSTRYPVYRDGARDTGDTCTLS